LRGSSDAPTTATDAGSKRASIGREVMGEVMDGADI
jgi:hypothetical protein